MKNKTLTVLNDDGTTRQIGIPLMNLSAVRANANLSQRELAKILDVDRTTINNWEKGKTKIATPWLMMFAEKCDNFPLDYIFLPIKSTKCS